ncbi:MAG TPA: S8/S53 family peptidase [Micromonosporaceae bacterium]|nr:S8/S53 family peptidase [Micromonosporaceae bacterium]
MSVSEDRLAKWRERRARRMRELNWLRADTAEGRPAVWYVADELLVRDDHYRLARKVLGEQGHRATDVAEEEDAPSGIRRYRVAGLDVPRAARTVRRRAEAAGDQRSAASPNHVFVSAPIEHGGPFGPPLPVAKPRGSLATPAATANAVAVVDTGVWRDSPLPTGRYAAESDDFVSDVDVDNDGIIDGDVGHANFIAGVILRRTANARVRIVRVLDTFGVCTEADLIAALGRVSGDRVINLSLGGFTLDDQPPLALRDALHGLLDGKDRVVVAAAGNDGQHGPTFWPAAFAGTGEPWSGQVVAVAAHDGTDVCPWSNRGDWVTLAAPGADVTSTYIHHEAFHSGWAQWSGTSFATPYVVAAVAEELAATGSALPALDNVRAVAAEHSYSGYPGLP